MGGWVTGKREAMNGYAVGSRRRDRSMCRHLVHSEMSISFTTQVMDADIVHL